MNDLMRKIEILEFVTHDETVSFTAKGVFAFLLNHNMRDDNNTLFDELRIYSCESSKEIKGALRELEERNYVVLTGKGEYEVNDRLINNSINAMEGAISEVEKQFPNG